MDIIIIFSFDDWKNCAINFLLATKGINWNNIIELIIKILFEKLKLNPSAWASTAPGVWAVKKFISKTKR